MNNEDYIDVRETFGPECWFKVDEYLSQINNKSLYSTIDKFCIFNCRKINNNKVIRHQLNEKQFLKFMRV
jgi:hypothetical protein